MLRCCLAYFAELLATKISDFSSISLPVEIAGIAKESTRSTSSARFKTDSMAGSKSLTLVGDARWIIFLNWRFPPSVTR